MVYLYSSKQYAEAFKSDYKPIYLPTTKSYMLERKVLDTDLLDISACYPRYLVDDYNNIKKDIDYLKSKGFISLVFASDVFSTKELEDNKILFEHFKPFKEHFICELKSYQGHSNHHKYEVKKASKLAEVKIIDLRKYLHEWILIYQVLIQKHNIKGVQYFSPQYFKSIANLDNLYTVAAFRNNELISAHIWIAHQDKVYSHLAASNDTGYETCASYLIYDYSINYFRDKGFSSLDLGSGAGLENANSGLTFFKQGFANDKRWSFICGKILDCLKYNQLSGLIKNSGEYFPAYRFKEAVYEEYKQLSGRETISQ